MVGALAGNLGMHTLSQQIGEVSMPHANHGKFIPVDMGQYIPAIGFR
jgi:hypothetical protein